MKVYFVRHGESESNATGVLLGAKAMLTEQGREQAKVVAQRFIDIPIDVIVSSTYPRAQDTAAIINEQLGKEILFSDLCVERRKPSAIYFPEADVEAISSQIIEHANDPNWHYGDEENFYDLKRRALDFLQYLISLQKENVLVVTHGMFLRYLILAMMAGDNLDADMARVFIPFARTKNTGITLCEYNSDGKTKKPWSLICWNDHAHL